MADYISLSCIKHKGELPRRCEMLAHRLESDIYQMPSVFENDGDWPGDWCGRTILAQTMLYSAIGRESPCLKETIDALPSRLNDRGFIGDFGDYIDEQQLSGHSWLLRGLCEYYKKFGDQNVLVIIAGIVNGLYLPICDYLAEYHIQSSEKEEYSGKIAVASGKWKYSSDTGCSFISLDGLTAVLELFSEIGDNTFFDTHRLMKMIDIMIGIFSDLDIVRIKLQTHAVLTASRGILRLYGLTCRNGNPAKKLLDTVSEVFSDYLDCGMSAAYGNYNWFGRPEWTEPCAIIDSFIVAVQLFAYTGETHYLNTASRIKSAIYHSQRENGGFGCDTCAGAITDRGTVDRLNVSLYEAYWCCTMRGGEGLARIAEYSYLKEGNTLIIPYTTDSEIEIEGLRVIQETDHSKIHLYVYGKSIFEKIKIYARPWMKNITVKGCPHIVCEDSVELSISPDMDVSIEFETSLFREKCRGSKNDTEKFLIFNRDSILGSLTDISVDSEYIINSYEYGKDQYGEYYKCDDMKLRRIDDSYLFGKDDKDASYFLLFR